MADIGNLVEELSKLTVIEAADLVKKLEEKWGVTAAAPVAVAAAGGAAAGGAPAAAAKDTFDVILGFCAGGQEDCRHQGGPRSKGRAGIGGSQGAGGRRAQAGARRRQQGRCGRGQKKARRSRRKSGSQITANYRAAFPSNGRRPFPRCCGRKFSSITSRNKQQFDLAGSPLNAARLPCVVV